MSQHNQQVHAGRVTQKLCLCVSGVCAAQTRCSQSDPADPEGSAGVYGGGTLSASLSHPLQSHALIS